MGTTDIFRIISTVAITQAICDLLAQRFVFSKEKYRHTLTTLERARTKRDKVLATNPPPSTTTPSSTTPPPPTSRSATKALEKLTKKIQRNEDDFNEAAANVSKLHTGPNVLTSLVFIILYRVLSSEYTDTMVAILPFQPWGLVKRLTLRGLTLDGKFDVVNTLMGGLVERVGAGSNINLSVPRVFCVTQGCGFLFLYILSNMSVKFLVHKLLGRKPPDGADKGVLNLMDDPQGKKILHSLGMDADELKEVKTSFGG